MVGNLGSDSEEGEDVEIFSSKVCRVVKSNSSSKSEWTLAKISICTRCCTRQQKLIIWLAMFNTYCTAYLSDGTKYVQVTRIVEFEYLYAI